MNDEELDSTSWEQYRRLIVSELDRLNDSIKALTLEIQALRNREIQDMKVDIATLKVKLAMLGVAAGAGGAGAVEVVKNLL